MTSQASFSERLALAPAFARITPRLGAAVYTLARSGQLVISSKFTTKVVLESDSCVKSPRDGSKSKNVVQKDSQEAGCRLSFQAGEGRRCHHERESHAHLHLVL